MTPVETEFRDVEGRLDKLLTDAKSAFDSAGFDIEDSSGRTYHYKNEHLFWSHLFRREWPVDIARARVTIRLFYGEPIKAKCAPPEINVLWRAELFKLGRESDADKRKESKLLLSAVENLGIVNVVTKALDEASLCLPKAL